MKKQPEGLRSTNNHSLPATGNKDDDDSNFYTQSKYKKFTNFIKESNTTAKQQQNKIAECTCWVCKILDSSSSVTNDETDTTTATKRYEPYNIVSETGDSIFYDPFLSDIFNDNDDKLAGEIYVSETAIEEIVNRIIDHHHQRLGPSLNNNKNGN